MELKQSNQPSATQLWKIPRMLPAKTHPSLNHAWTEQLCIDMKQEREKPAKSLK